MNKRLLHFTLATALFGSSTAFAANAGWYIGASGGGTKAKDAPSASEVDAELALLGFTSRSSVDDTDTGWKIFGGYKFNPNFAIEGNYADLGELSIKSIVTAPSSATINTSWEAKTWALSAVGIVPLAYKFDIFGKVGFQYWDVDYKRSAPARASESDNGTDLTYGIGADYNFTDRFALRAEWELYQNIGDSNKTGESDVEMWSAGLQFSF